MTFKDKLKLIQNDLDSHKRDRKELLAHYVQVRLTESLQNYYHELDNSYNYLKYRDDTNVLKKMNRD